MLLISRVTNLSTVQKEKALGQITREERKKGHAYGEDGHTRGAPCHLPASVNVLCLPDKDFLAGLIERSGKSCSDKKSDGPKF